MSKTEMEDKGNLDFIFVHGFMQYQDHLHTLGDVDVNVFQVQWFAFREETGMVQDPNWREEHCAMDIGTSVIAKAFKFNDA